MKKRNKTRILKNKCDETWARVTKLMHIKKHGKKCLWCGDGSKVLHSDHVVNRWKFATRWNVNNCVVICGPCHLFRKKRDPWEWARMVEKEKGHDAINDLQTLAREIVKPDYELILAGLLELEKIEESKLLFTGGVGHSSK